LSFSKFDRRCRWRRSVIGGANLFFFEQGHHFSSHVFVRDRLFGRESLGSCKVLKICDGNVSTCKVAGGGDMIIGEVEQGSNKSDGGAKRGLMAHMSCVLPFQIQICASTDDKIIFRVTTTVYEL